MIYRRLIPALAACLLAPLTPLISQETETPPAAESPPAAPAPTPLESAIQSFGEAYMAAFNKADAATVAAMYDEAGTYSADNGKHFEGRAAIEAGLKEYFEVHPGARLAVQSVSVRAITPEVAVENGLALLSATEGAEEATRFKAVYAKRGDSWKIVELDETVLPPADRGQLALGALDWMVGSWKDNGSGDAVTTKVAWIKEGHFLRRSITVKPESGESLQATEIIGWDPGREHIRSWVFDSAGGFGEGVWSREGNRWIVKTTSMLPDGARATSLNIFTLKDGNTYTWESTSREMNGEVLASIEKVEVVREPSPAAPPASK